MKRSLYRQIWKIRFEKMLKVELASAKEYEELLEECRKTNKTPAVAAHLERLVSDEKKHAKLCEQLLAILERQAK